MLIKRLLKNRVAGNAAWIIGCKIIQAVLGLVISMLTARYLGPSNYGLINYATSLALFVGPIAQLGFTSTLVYETIDEPQNDGTVFGSAMLISFTSSLLCMAGISVFLRITSSGESTTILVCELYSVLLLVQAIELIQYWFQAKLLSKYVAIVMLIVYVLISAYQIILLAVGASIEWYAIVKTLEHGLIALALLIAYYRLGGGGLHVSFSMIRKLIRNSRYFMLSSMLVFALGQSDRIMIKWLIDDAAMGFYSAAVVCANITDFVFMAIIDSFRPMILESFGKKKDEYERGISGLYSIIIYMSLLQSVFITVFSQPIVRILYGEAYAPAGNALRILTWYSAFSYIGSARLIWIQAEEQQSKLWKINMIGAICNIGLNALMIPHLGIKGAAIASLITQVLVNVGIGFIIPSFREHNRLLIMGADIRNLCRVVKRLL